MKNYDIVIIGGGIAGIYSMYNLKKKYPKLKVLLLEKEDRFGGRIYTYRKKIDNIDYIMDLGAGRIGFHHKLMVNLIDELKLTKYIVPITNTKNYIEYNKKTKQSIDKSELKEKYEDLLYKFLHNSKIINLSKIFLQKFYLNELLNKFIPKIIPKSIYNFIENSFEYKNKLFYLNAYNAINYFKYDYNSTSKFFILKTGYDSIIDNMLNKISPNKNYKLKKNSYVNDIFYNNETSKYDIFYNFNNENYRISCKHLICALPKCDLIKFNILSDYKKELNTINEISKVRIFEIYNKTKINNEEKIWFENIPKTSTNDNLEFIIPIDPKSGLIMSSYNENLSTQKNYWHELFKKSENLLKKKLHEHLCLIFNKEIPESKYIKLYYWKHGVACWKKKVDSNYVSQKILNLMPNFYICGENYSQYQAWCEGSLETSEEVINKISCILTNLKHNKSKKLKNKNI